MPPARILLLALAVTGCGTAALDELPSPETCEWQYDVGRVNDVALTMEIGAASAGGFTPLAGSVELGTTQDGRWGFAIDLRIATTDPVSFPETVCAEVQGTSNYAGGLSTRGLLFRRQADGSMLSRGSVIDPGVMPSPDAPFRGVVRTGHAISPSTVFGFDTYSDVAATSVIVDLVNNVGFLSDAPDAPSTDGGATDGGDTPQLVRNCYGTTSPYCTQFDMFGSPPADALLPYAPAYCPDDGVASGTGPCEEPFNFMDKSAVCTVPVTEVWGTMVIRQFTYGPIADSAGDAIECTSRGGTYMPL